MADGVAITAGAGTTIATDDAGASGHAQIVKLAISTDGSVTLIPGDAANGLDVDVTRMAALVAGSALVGDVGLQGRSSGGLTIFRTLDLDESEEEVKASAGQVYGYYFANRRTSELFLKFYNATAANVTVGTTTPVMTFPVPALTSGHVSFPQGIEFSTAVTVAVTTGIVDADTGAPAANDFVFNCFYE